MSAMAVVNELRVIEAMCTSVSSRLLLLPWALQLMCERKFFLSRPANAIAAMIFHDGGPIANIDIVIRIVTRYFLSASSAAAAKLGIVCGYANIGLRKNRMVKVKMGAPKLAELEIV
jgi:hypothetical protein